MSTTKNLHESSKNYEEIKVATTASLNHLDSLGNHVVLGTNRVFHILRGGGLVGQTSRVFDSGLANLYV